MEHKLTVPVITIDGPSGTGKGTICHMVAQYLHWHILDSGCIYRALALAASKQNINLTDTPALVQLALMLNLEFVSSSEESTKILLDGHNVAQEIRSQQCGQDASQIAILPEVREALLARQRDFAKLPGLVTDGRDMGTVVFPDAMLKIYLHATPQERAGRRYLQLQEQRIDVSFAEVMEELLQRDKRDSARLHAPLKPAKDAVVIDTTGLTIVQVFDNILELLGKTAIGLVY